MTTSIPTHALTDPARVREVLRDVLSRTEPHQMTNHILKVLARTLTTTGLPGAERERRTGGSRFGMGATWGGYDASRSGVTVSYFHARPPLAYTFDWAVVDQAFAHDARALADLAGALDAVVEHSRIFPITPNFPEVRRVRSDIHPEDRGLYRERVDAFHRDVLDPWRERQVELYADLHTALNEALSEHQGVLDLGLAYAPGLATHAPTPVPAGPGL